MHRKKLKSQFVEPQQYSSLRPSHEPTSPPNFIPEHPFSNKYSLSQYPDSLQRFQWELQKSLMMQKQLTVNSMQRTNNKRRRAMTEIVDSEEEQEMEIGAPYKKITKLQKQIIQLKEEVKNYNKNTGVQDKLDQVLKQMIKNREAEKSYYNRQKMDNSPPIPPNNVFYPPMPYYPPPNSRDRPYQKPTSFDKTSKSYTKPIKPKKGARRLLRKYLFVVAFTIFLKNQAKKLAALRKQTFRKFYLQKFDSQILNLKNWLVDAHGYSFPIILQKQEINLQFWKEKKEAIQRQKQGLLLKLVQLGIQKMKKDCVPQKISLFSEILQSLCGRGGFVMSRFWSAVEMQSICISQFYGCIRANQHLQKFMLGMVVFVKVLIFNMLLQPHKFDITNFSKSKKTLTNNMFIIASTYYRLIKQVLNGYLQEERSSYFKLGNWLNVKQAFIVQCCQPLIFNCEYPEEGEWISGLLGDQLQILQMRQEWSVMIEKIQQIIDVLHKQIVKRRREVVRNQKYKLYN